MRIYTYSESKLLLVSNLINTKSLKIWDSTHKSYSKEIKDINKATKTAIYKTKITYTLNTNNWLCKL